jgi:hypothetical protein
MSRYVKTEWILPTSVAVGRVFSKVKAATGYLHRSMSTRTLDGLLVLKLNWDLVSLDVVSDAIKSLRDDTVWLRGLSTIRSKPLNMESQTEAEKMRHNSGWILFGEQQHEVDAASVPAAL